MLCVGFLVMICSATNPTTPQVYCPPLNAYDRELQRAAAEELKKLPASSPVARMIADYGTLRAKCRAIRG